MKNQRYHAKILLKRFHLNGHTMGFRRQTQKLELQYVSIIDSRCAFLKTPEDFFGPKAIYEIQFLSRGVEVLSSKTSAKFLVNVGFYCFAFKTNQNWISVGKQNVPKIAFLAQKVFGSFEKRMPEVKELIDFTEIQHSDSHERKKYTIST